MDAAFELPSSAGLSCSRRESTGTASTPGFAPGSWSACVPASTSTLSEPRASVPNSGWSFAPGHSR